MYVSSNQLPLLSCLCCFIFWNTIIVYFAITSCIKNFVKNFAAYAPPIYLFWGVSIWNKSNYVSVAYHYSNLKLAFTLGFCKNAIEECGYRTVDLQRTFIELQLVPPKICLLNCREHSNIKDNCIIEIKYSLIEDKRVIKRT